MCIYKRITFWVQGLGDSFVTRCFRRIGTISLPNFEIQVGAYDWAKKSCHVLARALVAFGQDGVKAKFFSEQFQ